MFTTLFQAPSVSSKHGPDDLEGMTEDMDMSRNMFGFDQTLEPGFTQEQVDGKWGSIRCKFILS